MGRSPHPASILDILENFVFIAEEKEKEWDARQGRVVEKKKEILVFPRYHQLDVIRQLRQAVKSEGVGLNYLVQHTTGAGKSYSIAWLAFLLSSLYQTREDTERLYSTIVVVTDRRVLDKQLRDTIVQLERATGVVNPVDKTSQQLREYLEKGKDIIVTTIQKFPVISETISNLPGSRFAVIVDEVHSSQSGQSARHLKKTLNVSLENEVADLQEDADYEDLDTQVLSEMAKFQSKGQVSFFGFTGTPKNKTLKIFGRKNKEGKPVPFHSYTPMRQSITESFTLDVLKNYTTYKRYFKLLKEVSDDKEVPVNAATRALLHYVDGHPETISKEKVNIISAFSGKTAQEIHGKGRAMLVTRSRLHCVRYFRKCGGRWTRRTSPTPAWWPSAVRLGTTASTIPKAASTAAQRRRASPMLSKVRATGY
ncbi:MAG: type I restriction endonuclease subunit R [Saprospirales bacterium]|nr:type I restriction endonuclease subunit R [Saprospirales bacterium]